MRIFCPDCQIDVETPAAAATAGVCPVCRRQIPVEPANPLPADCSATPLLEATREEPSPRPGLGSDRLLPASIGRFRVIGVVGQGAFGTVYQAYDEELQRPVAVKVPRRDRFASDEQFAAFLAEARAAARLRHSSIVAVHDVGHTPEGTCFIVMDYVDGGSLHELLGQGRLAVDKAVKLLADVADAVAYANAQGLIHRDLKPSNILLDAEGRPAVADFGLAVQQTSPVLRTAQVQGTPLYMAPEQVRGENHRLDARTDQWAIGVILYLSLTGKHPFHGTRSQLFEEILNKEPVPPRRIVPTIPRDLERICLRCLAKRMSDRYSSAGEVAEELRVWLQSGARGGLGDEAAPTIGSPGPAASAPSTDRSRPLLPIVPKGLRSFGRQDAHFYLELLPGPRDRDELPDSVRFWKQALEATDPADAFPVGLLFGPSGCGKSSFLKAGLLPRLAPQVTAIYVEATPRETASRLLAALGRKFPALSEAGQNLTLAEVLVLLRSSELLPPEHKLVLVLDQFEQCLHARGQDDQAMLVQTLRHCDGLRVQCLLAVRDDFGMAATRFLSDLEVPLRQGWNFATIDRFAAAHARKVLAAFGRAFGQIPDAPGDHSPLSERFLDQAIAGLAEDERVIPVRLALFAEMLKDRPWTPQTLTAVGGAEGVGVAFLDQVFTSRAANPAHRQHQAAARRVLQRLLPEQGTQIRGPQVSGTDLLAASGYAAQPAAFAGLLQVLDTELRLITPAESEAADDADGSPQAPAEAYYQLSHDYLIPTLRTWLTRCQRETLRGRAELRLAERTAGWKAKPEKRQLPTLWEWADFGLFTSRRQWTSAQRQMMRVAGRHHVLRLAIAAGVLIVAVGAALWGRDVLRRDRQMTVAAGLVQRLTDAETGEVARIVQELDPHRQFVDPLLQQRLQEPALTAKQALHARLGLLPVDPSQLDPVLQFAFRAEPSQLRVIIAALGGHGSEAARAGWDRLAETSADPQERLRAACLVARYDPESPQWKTVAEDIAARLVSEHPLVAAQWVELLQPAKRHLREALCVLFTQPDSAGDQRPQAAGILAEYFGDDLRLMVDLLQSSDARSFEALLEPLKKRPQEAAELLREMLAHQAAAVWPDPPPDPLWKPPAPSLVQRIEQAQGLVQPHVAFCQTLPLADVAAVCGELQACGFRPHCFRPFAAADGVRVAAIWYQDGREWRAAHGRTAEQLRQLDAEYRTQGLIPADVASWADPNGEPGTAGALSYAALWIARGGAILDGQMYVDVRENEHEAHWRPLNDTQFVPRTNLLYRRPGEPNRYSSVRWKLADTGEYKDYWMQDASEYERGMPLGFQQADVRIQLQSQQEKNLFAATWWDTPGWISRRCEGVSPEQHLAATRQWLADGWRPVAISVVWQAAGQSWATASVWHHPQPTAADLDQLASRQAAAAAALVHLGQADAVWPLLRHVSEPRLRSQLIHRLPRVHVAPQILIARLDDEQDVSARRALLLALSGYAPTSLPTGPMAEWTARLWDLFQDSDAGVHSAARLCLQNLGQNAVLATAERQPAGRTELSDRTWVRSPQGHTLAVIRGPVEFLMGSPPREPHRVAGEDQHRVRIPRNFAISATEVTVRQFLQFDPQFPYAQDYCPDPECPITMVTIFDAMRYCRWLSEQEGIAADQMCYPPRAEIKEGMTLPADFLERTGYRLPTEPEWEFACRAGTTTGRYYGDADALLSGYAWTVSTSNYHAWPVAFLKPNDLGLFDMLGNAMEICHGREEFLPGDDSADAAEDTVTRFAATLADHRVRRGGAFLYQPADARAAHRDGGRVNSQFAFLGFRVVRSVK